MRSETENIADQASTRAELRNIFSADIDDLRSYAPGEVFSGWLQAIIGPAGERGDEEFQFCVCSPSWLANEVDRQEILFGRFLMITSKFDYDVIERRVQQKISEATGKDWNEVALKLSRCAYWEFEDYDSMPTSI